MDKSGGLTSPHTLKPSDIFKIKFFFFVFQYLDQISMVKMVEAELNTEVKDDIIAAIITARMSPLTPLQRGYLTEPVPNELPHTLYLN